VSLGDVYRHYIGKIMTNLLTNSVALAADNVATVGSPQNPIMGMVPIIILCGIFYFFMIRPQQKKAKAFAQMLDALNIGDKVATAGGIIGHVQSIDNGTGIVELRVNDTTLICVFKKAITDIISK